MKTSAKAAAIGLASTFGVVALLVMYPAMAAPNGPLNGTALAPTSSGQSIVASPAALTVGQTLTFTSTNGQYRQVGAQGASGTASGTVVFTVTGAFRGGYSLSITSGSITIGGTTYSVASGSAEMGPHEAHLVGQGAFSSATPGSFLVAAGAHANFQGQTYNTLRLDVQTAGAEYGVVLLVTVTVA